MSSKEVGFKDGTSKEFNPSKQVRVGIRNLHRWILIKESLGFISDSQFASFLLNLAEQQDNTPENNTTTDTAAAAAENVERIDSQQHQKMEATKTRERTPPDGTGHVYEGGDSEYEEEESFEEDDEDDDWKPSGCRQPRVMKRPSRGRKKYQSQRQTRSQSKAALTDRDIEEKILRRQSYSQDSREGDETNEEEEEEDEEEYDHGGPIPALKVSLKSCCAGNSSSSRQIVSASQRHHDSNKSAMFRSRICGDCGLKHSMGECPLLTPTLIVSDLPYDPESTLVQAEATLPKVLISTNLVHYHLTANQMQLSIVQIDQSCIKRPNSNNVVLKNVLSFCVAELADSLEVAHHSWKGSSPIGFYSRGLYQPIPYYK